MNVSQQLETHDSGSGSAREWDAVWKTLDETANSRSKLFTRTSPKTMYEFWQLCYFEDLLKTTCPQPNWELLELASGRGTTSMYLASRGFENITLLDLSGTALEQAKKNFASEGLREPKTIVGDAVTTGLPGNSFDLIYNIGVLEHFEDPSRILAESLRLLKPGGSIFMPIVPEMPYLNSAVCRTFLNPLSMAKQMVKKIIRRRAVKTTMVRTKTGANEYLQIATDVGFSGVQCIPYNPYWKVHGDGSIFEKNFDIPLYRAHYWMKKKLGFQPRLRTWKNTCLCLLLTGQKAGE
jgi:ubiquinone/menaquinone biosynthesis C-methylase UbiE